MVTDEEFIKLQEQLIWLANAHKETRQSLVELINKHNDLISTLEASNESEVANG